MTEEERARIPQSIYQKL